MWNDLRRFRGLLGLGQSVRFGSASVSRYSTNHPIFLPLSSFYCGKLRPLALDARGWILKCLFSACVSVAGVYAGVVASACGCLCHVFICLVSSLECGQLLSLPGWLVRCLLFSSVFWRPFLAFAPFSLSFGFEYFIICPPYVFSLLCYLLLTCVHVCCGVHLACRHSSAVIGLFFWWWFWVKVF